MRQPTTIHREELKLYDEIADRLEEAAADREHPFHLISLATVGLDGTPRARMVVLRQYLRDERTLIFHSDRRSPKIFEIMYTPRVSLVCYDHASRIQLRMAATVTVHIGDSVMHARWIASQVPSKRHYLSPLAPSTPIDYPRPYADETPWTAAMDEAAMENFCAVSCHLNAIDFLDLDAHGNRRTNLNWSERGTLEVQALMP